jgi:hypothetical protein
LFDARDGGRVKFDFEILKSLMSPGYLHELPKAWRDMRRADTIEDRGFCLRVLDRRPADSRDQSKISAAVRAALAMWPHGDTLVASELRAVVATEKCQYWQGAPACLCGIYYSPFNNDIHSKPHYLAIELYGAAAVHRADREQGITRFQEKHIPWLQHVAWKYQEALMKASNMPGDWLESFRQMRSVVPGGYEARL